VKQSYRRHLNAVRIFGYEFLRTLLYWSLALLIAVPARLASAETAPSTNESAPAVEAEQNQFSKLMTLVEKLEKVPQNDPTHVTLKAEAAQLSQELQLQVQAEFAPFEAEYVALKKQANDEKRDFDQTKLDELIARAKPTLQKKQLLLEIAGKEGQPMIGVVPDGTAGPMSAEKMLASTLEVEKASPETAEGDSPTRLHERVANGLLSGGVTFTSQYFTFSVAMGFIALSQMGIENGKFAIGGGAPTDPNALENWVKQTFNLMGAEGFAMFMVANHSSIKLLKWMRYGDMPVAMLPSYMNYLGMTAGSVVQSLFSELREDKDVRSCVKPYYTAGLQANPGACEKMRETWITKGKALQYAPSILSMVSSTMFAAGIRSSLSAISDPEAFRPVAGANRLAHIKFKGAVLINKTKGGKLIAKMVKLFPGKLVGIGDFVLFLALDTYVTQEPINRGWQNIKMNYVDANAWMNKNWDMHAEFFWPKEGSLQAIANAFDVEATTPLTAHTYLMDEYRKLQESNWKKPAGPEACVPKSISAAAKAVPADELKNKWIWQRWWIMSGRKKTQDQLTCEVLSRPSDLLSRYGDTSRDWRGVVMGPFSAAQNNWLTMLNQFTSTYGASMKLANHLAQAKYNMIYKNAPKPDLSREALAQVIGSPLPKEGEGTGDGADSAEKANSMFLDNTWVPTPELVDFVVAGFACGPDANLDPTQVSVAPIPKWFDTIYAVFARQISSPSYMTTPWGSSLHFIPPKLTNKSRAVCENVQNSVYDTLNIMLGSHLPTLSAKTAKVLNPFTGPFVDEANKSYETMAEYIFDNIDPDVYKPVGNYTGFPLWWANHLTKQIIPVYANYSKVFDQLIQERYFPLVFDKTFKFGARAEEDSAHQSNAYRVANGFFGAIEIEMRNYLRGMYSLYASTFDKGEKSDDQKKAFMELANGLVADIQTVQAEDLRNKDFDKKLSEADESLKAMSQMIESRLHAKLTADSEFRLEMLKKFQEQITKVIGDERAQIDLVKMWNFTGASTRGPVQRVDTPTSANPIRRGGG
jgi:hypothetical protein